MNTEIFDLGKIGITLGGEYDNQVIYEKLTIVLYKGKSYISTKTVQGISPEQDIRSWQLVAEAKDAYHMLVDAGKTTLTEEEFLEQLVDATNGRYIVQGNITNAADEEDLTVEHSDLLGIDTLKLANRDNTNGIGYVILRKNKSFTEQVTKENTIYEIRYEFDLNGEEIVIPENCIFDFNGGCLSNGMVNFNNTILKNNVKCFTKIKGYIKNSVINAIWFGIIGDDKTDNTVIFNNIFSCIENQNKIVILPTAKKPYLISSISIKGYTTFKGLGGILKVKDGFAQPNGIQYPIHNLYSSGHTILDGLIIDGNWRGQNQIQTNVCDSVTICGDESQIINCRITDSIDSGIMFSNVKNGKCCNNYIDGANDLGIYVNDGTGTNFYNNEISGNICKNASFGGIALKRICSKVIVSHNIIQDCGNGITLENASAPDDYSTNMQICNNLIINPGIKQYENNIKKAAGRGISLKGSYRCIISNNKIENFMHHGIYLGGTEDCIIEGNIIYEDGIHTSEPNNYPSAIILVADGKDEEKAFISKNTIITANVISTKYTNIGVNPNAPGKCYNLTITGNKCILRNNGYNIDDKGRFENCIISNNSFINDNQNNAGIYLRNGGENNIISGNNLDVINQSSKTHDILGSHKIYGGTEIPTDGTYTKGDIILNNEPTAQHNKELGWICLSSGTPGVWAVLRCGGPGAKAGTSGAFHDYRTKLQNSDLGFSYFMSDFMKSYNWDGSEFRQYDGILWNTHRHGRFDQKPTKETESKLYPGFNYYCTNLKNINTDNVGTMIYYIDTVEGVDVWVDAGGRLVDSEYPKKYKGLIKDIPSLTTNDKGVSYYATDINCMLYWTGSTWSLSNGWSKERRITGGSSTIFHKFINGQLTANDIGHIYYLTDTKKPYIWNGETFVNFDGTPWTCFTSGLYSKKPTVENDNIPIGFAYFCTNKKTIEGNTEGIIIYHKGNNIWVDSLGRVIE